MADIGLDNFDDAERRYITHHVELVLDVLAVAAHHVIGELTNGDQRLAYPNLRLAAQHLLDDHGDDGSSDPPADTVALVALFAARQMLALSDDIDAEAILTALRDERDRWRSSDDQ